MQMGLTLPNIVASIDRDLVFVRPRSYCRDQMTRLICGAKRIGRLRVMWP